MKRTNIYLSEKQLDRLRERAEREEVAMAELIRRAVDSFLAWDDPTYHPQPGAYRPPDGAVTPQKERAFHPHV